MHLSRLIVLRLINARIENRWKWNLSCWRLFYFIIQCSLEQIPYQLWEKLIGLDLSSVSVQALSFLFLSISPPRIFRTKGGTRYAARACESFKCSRKSSGGRTRALTRKSNDCREGQAQADTTAETGRACGRSIRVQRPGAHAGDVQSAAWSAEEGEGPQAGSEEPQTHVAGTGSHSARNHQGHLHHD